MLLGEEQAPDLVSGKAHALLCYLAVNGRSYSRQALAGLLWGDLPEVDARRNLRGVLMKLRQVAERHLEISHQSIAFNAQSPHWIDVLAFQKLAVQETPDAWQQAVALYRGEFLETFYDVRDAPDFEAWVGRQRLRLHQLAVGAYEGLIRHEEKSGAVETAVSLARRLLELDPTREASHRHLMRLFARQGERHLALEQYESCRRILAHDLGVEPSAETIALAAHIRSGDLPPNSPITHSPILPISQSPNLPSPDFPAFIAGPPITYPPRFFGRRQILKRLYNLFRQRPLQNAAIIGPRRSGKTSLLHVLRALPTAPAARLRPDQQAEWLPDPARYRWVFADFQDPRLGTRDGLLRHLLAEMGFDAPADCHMDRFMDLVADGLQQPTIVLFDEIGVALQRYPELDDAFWEGMRSLATNQVNGNLGFVLTSHEPPGQLAEHSGLGSPFFNIFGYVATLGPLSETAARDLIATSPIPISEADAEWMLAESGRWPFLLQILCRERLLSLEDGDDDPRWREQARQQIAPFLRLRAPE